MIRWRPQRRLAGSGRVEAAYVPGFRLTVSEYDGTAFWAVHGGPELHTVIGEGRAPDVEGARAQATACWLRKSGLSSKGGHPGPRDPSAAPPVGVSAQDEDAARPSAKPGP